MKILTQFLFFTFCFIALNSQAAIKNQTVQYSVNGDVMEGYLVFDPSQKTPRPAVLIVHDWMGLGKFAKDKADSLAKQGYVAFAADIYGKGIRPKDATEAGQLATQYKEDRKRMRAHVQSAFDKLLTFKEVDPKKTVAMGYCFGGTVALELARAGTPLSGTVSFHGGLSTPHPEDAKNIKGSVLVLHGADDPFVPPTEVQAFKDEMKNAHVKMDFITYPGAVHAFTNPDAGNDNSKGAAYNKAADKKSWTEFEKFLKKVF